MPCKLFQAADGSVRGFICSRDNASVEKHRLADLTPMPFGKHRGTPMQDVPASYLHWLWTQGKSTDKTCPVADYIRRNMEALKKEYPNGIWEE